MRITKWGEYGILCCIHMGRTYSQVEAREASVGAAELAYSLGIPLQYTQQILQRLRKGGLIESARGPGGGYFLARSPDEINLKEILQVAEGETFEVICDHNSIFEDCAESSRACSLKAVWHELKVTIDTLLSGKTLDHLIKEQQTALNNGGQNNLVAGPHRQA